FLALVIDPYMQGDINGVWRNAVVIVIAVAALQVPYVVHQVSIGYSDSAMGAVTDSVGRILSGREWPEVSKSVAGYAGAFNFIQVMPWTFPLAWVLLACGSVLAIRCWRDPLLLTMTLVPQVMAIAGYAFFLAALDHYYYLSLMPAAVMTIVLGV